MIDLVPDVSDSRGAILCQAKELSSVVVDFLREFRVDDEEESDSKLSPAERKCMVHTHHKVTLFYDALQNARVCLAKQCAVIDDVLTQDELKIVDEAATNFTRHAAKLLGYFSIAAVSTGLSADLWSMACCLLHAMESAALRRPATDTNVFRYGAVSDADALMAWCSTMGFRSCASEFAVGTMLVDLLCKLSVDRSDRITLRNFRRPTVFAAVMAIVVQSPEPGSVTTFCDVYELLNGPSAIDTVASLVRLISINHELHEQEGSVVLTQHGSEGQDTEWHVYAQGEFGTNAVVIDGQSAVLRRLDDLKIPTEAKANVPTVRFAIVPFVQHLFKPDAPDALLNRLHTWRKTSARSYVPMTSTDLHIQCHVPDIILVHEGRGDFAVYDMTGVAPRRSRHGFVRDVRDTNGQAAIWKDLATETRHYTVVFGLMACLSRPDCSSFHSTQLAAMLDMMFYMGYHINRACDRLIDRSPIRSRTGELLVGDDLAAALVRFNRRIALCRDVRRVTEDLCMKRMIYAQRHVNEIKREGSTLTETEVIQAFLSFHAAVTRDIPIPLMPFIGRRCVSVPFTGNEAAADKRLRPHVLACCVAI